MSMLINTLADLGYFTSERLQSFPYDLNFPVVSIETGSTPARLIFRMDLEEDNQAIARNDIEMLNVLIKSRPDIADLFIPIKRLAFAEYKVHTGYTRLKCTPYTYRGGVSSIPFSLFFTTDEDKQDTLNDIHGEIFYYLSGTICKAKIHFRRSGILYTYDMRIRDESLYIHSVTSSIKLDKKDQPSIIYKAE